MDNIIECIYRSCDKQNTNSVTVSSLVDFIKPYMPNNLNELIELQTQLDPDNSDQCVSFDFFQSAMSDWIARIQEDDTNNSFSEFTNMNQSFSIDVSHISKPSNNNTIDLTSEEQIEKLKQQLNKATNELDLVRQQLASCEDQNESLLTELNSRQTHNREQITKELSLNQSRFENEAKEQAHVASEKCERLERLLSNCNKQKQKYLAEIVQLESENQQLKNKLETFEKMKKESRKSVSELQDSLDVKEAEIATLLEIIENLKSEVEDKTERLSFFSNERKLLKERNSELEQLLQKKESDLNSSFRNVFNTPKLLNQLANPISPNFNSPGFTSSPKRHSLENGSRNGFDLFGNSTVATRLRSPHKTLKEEIEIADEKSQVDELQRLYKVVKDQEDLKNSLWENMKQLSSDKETLLDYRKDYLDLIEKMEAPKQNVEVVRRLIAELTKIEENLHRQKAINADLRILGRNLDAAIKQKLPNMLNKSMETDELPIKTMLDKSMVTDELSWVIPEKPPSQRSNYAKQQMKIDRLLEKQEKIDKDLANERGINTKLTLKHQELCQENEKNKKESETYREKLLKQTQKLKELRSENTSLQKSVRVLERENMNLRTEIGLLKDEKAGLKSENHHLDESLRNTLNRLAVETSINRNLGMENELLMNQQHQLESKVKEEFVHEVSLKKQLIDLRNVHVASIRQLQAELEERRTEIRTLRKQIEVVNVEAAVAACNEELRRAILTISECFKFDDDVVKSVPNRECPQNDSLLGLENEMILLSGNINSVNLLLRNVYDQHLSLLKSIENRSDSSDDSTEKEESFLSCCSDVSFAREVPDIVPQECDSFLDNLHFEHINLKHLSRKEMEEKFATLALLLTVDVTTLKKRSINENERFHQLTMKFFSCLNYTSCLLDKLKKSEKRRVSTNLELLKGLSEDMFKSAVRCGVLHYEKRAANCWKLVINYVAILSQENKEMKENELEEKSENQFLVSEEATSATRHWSDCSRFKFWLYSSFLMFVVFVIALLFYVDQVCPKNGKRTCPVQWIVNLFVEKTYSHNFHL